MKPRGTAMLVRFTKNRPEAAADTLTCVRSDGSTTTREMPRQGILPRDAACFVVEQRLGWTNAHFGAIARGRPLAEPAVPPRAIATDTKTAPESASAAGQCAALVECLQGEQWGGATDPAAFAIKLRAACRRHGVVTPALPDATIADLRAALREFGAAWRPLTPGQSVERSYP
ncbi:hypothetical protein [Horticoccus sp. 23ND18S-11]